MASVNQFPTDFTVTKCQNNLYTVILFIYILMPDPEPLLTGLARRPVPDSETQSLGIRYQTPRPWRPWVSVSGTGPRDTSNLKKYPENMFPSKRNVEKYFEIWNGLWTSSLCPCIILQFCVLTKSPIYYIQSLYFLLSIGQVGMTSLQINCSPPEVNASVFIAVF